MPQSHEVAQTPILQWQWPCWSRGGRVGGQSSPRVEERLGGQSSSDPRVEERVGGQSASNPRVVERVGGRNASNPTVEEAEDDEKRIEEEHAVKVTKDPGQRTPEEVTPTSNHYRAWCTSCVVGWGRNAALDEEKEKLLPTIAHDFAFLEEMTSRFARFWFRSHPEVSR